MPLRCLAIPGQVLVPVVLGILRGAMEACPAPPSPDAPVAISPQLLLKEASYDAVGAASYDLHDHVDLESWSVPPSVRHCHCITVTIHTMYTVYTVYTVYSIDTVYTISAICTLSGGVPQA